MKNNLQFVSAGLPSVNPTMKDATRKNISVAFLIFMLFVSPFLWAQQLQMNNFAVFSGKGNTSGCTSASSPGAGVQIGCNATINGGAVGSLELVQTTGAATISGDIHSKERVDLAASCIVTGKISVANLANVTTAVLAVATGSTLGGNIDVNGNSIITGGNVYGKLTHPAGTSYFGPVPGGGEVIGTPTLPVFPALPTINSFSSCTSQPDINCTKTITPGVYDDVRLPGSATLTFSGTGDYIFDKIKNIGTNNFVFDFKNSASGTIRLLVHGDVDLDRIKVNIVNGGSASRIYTEVHGNGSSSSNGTYAFLIANGPLGGINSSWVGTVWAPYAAIKIGSLSGGTDITGALWSGTQVNIRCGVNLNAAPYVVPACSTPNVSAGADKQINCSQTTAQLSGSSTTTGVSFKWVASNGGNIVSGSTSATPVVNSAGTYTLTVTSSGGCTATDVAQVTSSTTVPNVNAGADKQLTCTSNSLQLSGSSTSTGISYKWVASAGGNIVSGSTTATPTVNAAGTYTLTVTSTANGCKASDVALVTLSGTLPNANAGADKQITCSVPSVTLSGSSTTPSVSYSWMASNGGNIVSGSTTATPLVNAAGTYTLTVTSSGGCVATDVALVSSATTAPNANAGADKQLTCTTSSLQLSGSSTSSGISYKWVASAGGNIVSGSTTATPTVNAAGTYTLTVTSTANGCKATDVALVTFSGTLPNANAGADKQITCAAPSVMLNGSSTSSSISYSWIASNGGNIVSGANTATPTVNATGTYTLTVTKTSTGCSKTDVAVVTGNINPPNVNAGPDVELSCLAPSAYLSGSSTTPNAQLSWTSGNLGNIVSGATTGNPLVNGVASYILTVTDPANGCTATDIAQATKGCILLYYPDDTVGKVNNIIGSELLSLFKNFKSYKADTTRNIFRLDGNKVWIEVIAFAGQRAALASLLTTPAYGLTDTVNNGNSLIITGKFPISRLLKLDSLTTMIDYCRPLYAPIVLANAGSGVAYTQGDSAMKANIVRNNFDLKGAGVKVGIISDSYNYNTRFVDEAPVNISNGDLPGTGNPDGNTLPINVLKESIFRSSDEGRAMAQIVHDVAPKSEIAFRTGFIDANDFALGIVQLQQAGCKVIVDDVTYITEPFFTDGVVANAVDYVASQGVSYFSAAGNFGGKSYQSTFNPAPTPPGKTGFAHNFGGGDRFQKVSLQKVITLL